MNIVITYGFSKNILDNCRNEFKARCEDLLEKNKRS